MTVMIASQGQNRKKDRELLELKKKDMRWKKVKSDQ